MADRKVLEIRPTKVSQILKLKEPISHRTLSTREQIILLESSKVHGFVFPPWKSAPTSSEFESKLGMAPFLYVSCSRSMVILKKAGGRS